MQVETEINTQMITGKSIEEIAKEAIPKITVLGVGGGGSNIVSWMKRGAIGAKIIALNSDAQHLSISKADDKILLGYKTTGGLGCGGFPEQGAAAAEESAIEIEKAVGDSELVFLTTTLGGGTGTGASPIIARITKELGSLTLGVVTIPFEVEGTRQDRAKEGLAKLVEICDSVIVVDNNKLRRIAGALPIKEAFGVSGGICAIGFGEGEGDNKVETAVDKALNSQLLDVGDIGKARGALVHIEGGEDMTLEDINRAGELVLERVSPTSRVTWGAKINSELEDRIRATIVLAGVDSLFLLNEVEQTKKPKKKAKIVPVGNTAKKTTKKKLKGAKTR